MKQGQARPAARALKAFKRAVVYYVVATLVRLLQRLSLASAVRLGHVLGDFARWSARRERERALRNLQLVQPELGERERRTIVRAMFRHLGRSAMECVAMGQLRRKLGTASSPVTFAAGSLEVLEEAVAQGRGVIYVTAHLGNFELMAATVARVAPVAVLSKPSYDPRFTRMIERFREQCGVESIWVTQPMHLRRALAALRRGAILGVLLDQPVSGGCTVPFLGHPAATSTLAAALSQSVGAPIVVGFVHRCAPCQHAIVVQAPGQNRATLERTLERIEVTEQLTARIEAAVRAHPDQWMWSLDRWRSAESRGLSSSNAICIPATNN